MSRNAKLIAAIAVLFAATVAILTMVIPGPHRPTDYMVIGGIATMLCLVVLFVVLLSTPGHGVDALFKKHKNGPDQSSRTSTDL